MTDNLRKFETLKLAFNINHPCAPTYFTKYLTTKTSVVRHTRNNTYIVPDIDGISGEGMKSFKYYASHLWINLPTEVSNIDSFCLFKIKLKEYLLNNQIEDMAPEPCINNFSCISDVINNFIFSSDDEN